MFAAGDERKGIIMYQHRKNIGIRESKSYSYGDDWDGVSGTDMVDCDSVKTAVQIFGVE